MRTTEKKEVPEGWTKREGFEDEWFLESDREASQPIGMHVSSFDRRVDYSGKKGFQCTLDEFAGRFCYIAPLRRDLMGARTDCYEFMNAHSEKMELENILSGCYRGKGWTWEGISKA